MGYEVRRTIRLKFEDPEGGEAAYVVFRSMTLADLKRLDESEGVNEMLAEYLVEWDFTLDGEPLSTDLDGVMSLDAPLRNLLVSEWGKAVRTAHPLVLKSDAGQQSDPPPMTMESL